MARSRRGSAAMADDAGPLGGEPGEGPESDPEARPGVLPDMLRRMMALGFSGLFGTEAAIRGALGDTVPREWVEFVSEQSERTRAEFAQRLAEELGRVLEQVDLVEFAEQLLEGRTVEVKAEFRLGPRTRPPAATSDGSDRSDTSER